MQEPNKHAVLAYLRGEAPPPPRRALCILQAPPKNMVIEALVCFEAPKPTVLSWKEVSAVGRRGGAAFAPGSSNCSTMLLHLAASPSQPGGGTGPQG